MSPYDMLVQQISDVVDGRIFHNKEKAEKIANALIDVIRDEILRNGMGDNKYNKGDNPDCVHEIGG